MRTTLDLNDALLTRAKVAAAQEGTSLTRLIERGLALVLEETPQAEAPRAPFTWQVFGGSGTPMSLEEYERRVEAADDEYDRRQAGLLGFAESDDA